MFALLLFDMRLGPVFVVALPAAFAVAGILFSIALISLSRWLSGSGRQGGAILPKRFLVKVVWT